MNNSFDDWISSYIRSRLPQDIPSESFVIIIQAYRKYVKNWEGVGKENTANPFVEAMHKLKNDGLDFEFDEIAIYNAYNAYKSTKAKKKYLHKDNDSKKYHKDDKDLTIKTAFLKIDNYLDNTRMWYEIQPFYYDENGIYWFWDSDEFCWTMVDEVEVMSALDRGLGFCGQTINKGVKGNYLEAVKRVGRENKPLEVKKEWVQFREKIYNYKTGEKIESSPKYFICNPIPWNIGENDSTPEIDKLLRSWVAPEYVQTMYEILAFCCLADYPLNTFFCLLGGGRNGKTKFQKLVRRFIGTRNVCSTELDSLIDNRFGSAKLYKKLVCLLGETNFDVINKTSILKRLTGGDLIDFEFKHKTPFDDINYAKIMINTNSLPSTNDTSEGFYRRWFIIDFINEFEEGPCPVDSVPDYEFNALAKKCVTILPQLLSAGKFANQGSIKERQHKYILASNPLSIFIQHTCHSDMSDDCYSTYSELYTAYIGFLGVFKRRRVKKKEFSEALTEEGFEVHRTVKTINGEYRRNVYVNGLRFDKVLFTTLMRQIKEQKLSHLSHLSTSFPQDFPICKTKFKLMDKRDKMDKISRNNGDNGGLGIPIAHNPLGWDERAISWNPCLICAEVPTNLMDDGTFLCKDHVKINQKNEDYVDDQ